MHIPSFSSAQDSRLWQHSVYACVSAVCTWLFFVTTMSHAHGKSLKTSNHIANYQIKVRLFPKKKTLEGELKLDWKNTSNTRIRKLWFHMYMNAFKNEKSTFFKEWMAGGSGGYARTIRKGHWGWIKVKSLKIDDEKEHAKAITFASPDDGNPDDRTVFWVPLAKPLSPGKSTQVKISFTTRLPRAFARTGYRKNYFFVGQWYPKIGVYEKAGVRGAKQGRWNCHQFHAYSEFYADFGKYNVSITVPSPYVVGATGSQTSSTTDKKKGTKTYTFEQNNVHDFAWTAYPHFVRVVQDFVPEKDVSLAEVAEAAKLLGLPKAQLELKKVKMIFLLQPEHIHLKNRHIQALKNGLKYYGLWYGAYPHKTITLVDPVWEGSERATSGMEYPTLFTAGTRKYIGKKSVGLENLIIHEFGHQYFQGLVASNEFEEPWLDEGVNTYTNGVLLDKVYPDRKIGIRILGIPIPFPGFGIKQRQVFRLGYMALHTKMDAVSNPSWDFVDRTSYGKQVYAKAALLLRTIENVMGPKQMARAMRKYVELWRYRHPHTKDFLKVLNGFSKQDLTPLFNGFLHGTNELDYAVTSLRSTKSKKARGLFSQTKPKQKTPTSKPSANQKKKTKSPKTLFHSTFTVKRKGEIIFPVEIKVVFEDGKTMYKKWDGIKRWKHFQLNYPSKVRSVEIDPKHKLLIDINFSNNSIKRKKDRRTTLHWTLRLFLWFQNLLIFLSSLG